MRFQEIREAFQLCGVSISNDGVLLTFPQYDPPDALSISLDNEVVKNIGVFHELLGNSNSVTVSLYPGFYAGFSFDFEIPIDSAIVFPPIKTAIEREEEMQKIVNEHRKVISKDYLEVFHNVDMENEVDVKHAMMELAEIRNRGEVISLQGIKDGYERWENLNNISVGFLKDCNFGLVTIERPSYELPFGSIEFHMESEKRRVFEIPNQKIDGFSKIIHASSALTMDSYTDKDVSMLTFTVFS